MYEGPGIYRHYKGGFYIAAGLVRLEYNDKVHVLYQTLDPEHRKDQFHRGLLGTVRPLTEAEGPDWFNDVLSYGLGLRPRFAPVVMP